MFCSDDFQCVSKENFVAMVTPQPPNLLPFSLKIILSFFKVMVKSIITPTFLPLSLLVLHRPSQPFPKRLYGVKGTVWILL